MFPPQDAQERRSSRLLARTQARPFGAFGSRAYSASRGSQSGLRSGSVLRGGHSALPPSIWLLPCPGLVPRRHTFQRETRAGDHQSRQVCSLTTLPRDLRQAGDFIGEQDATLGTVSFGAMFVDMCHVTTVISTQFVPRLVFCSACGADPSFVTKVGRLRACRMLCCTPSLANHSLTWLQVVFEGVG